MKFILGLLLTLLITNTYAQDWDHVILNISSREGNASCHRKGLEFTFDYSVTLPGNVTTMQGSDTYKETYTLETPSFGQPVIVDDAHGIASILSPTLGNPSRRVNTIDLSNGTGNFNGRYPANSGATSMKYALVAVVRYVHTRTYQDVNGNTVTDILADTYKDFLQEFTFAVNDDFAHNAIKVDNTPTDTLWINPLDACQSYVLSANAVGATAYQWTVPHSNWLSASSDATTNTIEIEPDWTVVNTNAPQRVLLEAFQACGSSTISEVRELVILLDFPELIGDAICYNGGPTTLSIPPAATTTTLLWTVDQAIVNLVSGQGTNSIQIQANSYYRQNTLITLDITTPCGVFSIDYTHWVGKPLPQSNTLTGVTTAMPGNSRTFIGSPADGIVTNYTWWVPQNSGPTPPFCTDCWKVLQSSVGSDRKPFAHIQIGKNDGFVQAIYENNCGNSAAILYVDVQENNPGGGGPGLCCDVPVPKIMQSENNTTAGTIRSVAANTSVQSADLLATVYPNPANDLINIELDAEYWSDENFQVTLYSLASGKRLLQTTIATSTSMNLSELAAGVYWLEIKGAYRKWRQKVIKQ